MRNAGVCLIVVAVLFTGSAGGVADNAPPPRHLIYLHGWIVQAEQSGRPRHPQFGYYELEKILNTFRDRGFVVSGEIRPKSASVSDSADRVVQQVRKLLESGVPADHITVVGSSMGASIALVASVRLQNPDVRYCILGACLSDKVRGIEANEGQSPSGRLLSIREASDDVTGTCPSWRNDVKSALLLVAREIVLQTGLRHGFIYRPLREWVNPVVEWAETAGARRAGEPLQGLPLSPVAATLLPLAAPEILWYARFSGTGVPDQR
jgi:pimeloyl-ACP methyl ester carboxylesterase